MLSAIVLFGLLLTLVTAVPVGIQLHRRHPRGLVILFFVELWERFSFYGMRSLLIFYLTQHFLFDDGFSARTFGSFTTLAYLLPLLAGFVADRYIGARQAVVFGAVLLVIGHLLMTIEGPPTRQILSIDNNRFEVTTVQRAERRELALLYEAHSYAMRQSVAGDLEIEGLPAGSTLNSVIPRDRFVLSAAASDPFYVNLLFLALSCIALGVGFLKGNVSCLVGLLYPRGDPRQDAGFTLYYFGINIGSFWAALWCGYLGFAYGWAWGFGLAAAGMVAGLVVFILGKPLLEGHGEAPDRVRLKQPILGWLTREHAVYLGSLLSLGVIFALMRRNDLVGWTLLAASIAVLSYVGRHTYRSHSRVERQRIYLALLLVAAAILFWMLFLQGGTSLNLFADRNTDLTLVGRPWVLNLFDRQIFLGTPAMLEAAPVAANRIWIDASLTAAQVQSFNVAFVMIFAPFFAWLWPFLSRRGLDPSPMTKFGLGLVQVGAGFLVIVVSRQFADPVFRLPLLVLGITYLLHTTGELFVSPIGLSELTRLAPPVLVSTMMAIWLLASSAAQYIGALIASVASVQTVGGQALSAADSLASSLHVFNSVGWFGVIAGVFFLILSPFVRGWAHREH
jgi:POT family proton-dependent oligopeptide transporter